MRIYLEDHPPARRQYREGRRAPIKPVIVVHTAESGTDPKGADPKAEAVAKFIRNRTSPGSYHLIGDSDSIIQLVAFGNEAFHDATGSNRWSIGISLAMNAADWPTLTSERRDQLIWTAVDMAVTAAKWLVANGHDAPAARRLMTKTESDRADASGFIGHGDRDPTRRTDPGVAFPWTAFLDRYEAAMAGPDDHVAALQALLNQRGHSLAVDGEYGPLTHAANMDRLDLADAFDQIAGIVIDAGQPD